MFPVITYIAAITTANLTVATFGPWFSVINSFLLIGLDLSLRDRLHERWRGKALWPRMLALIASAGAISYILNPASAQIAIASVVAFCASAMVDTLIYRALDGRDYIVKANASNAAGALADSLIFPTLAFGGLLPAIVAMQFASKMAGGALWSIILRRK